MARRRRRNPPSEHLRTLPVPGQYAQAWRRVIDAVGGRIRGYDPDRFDPSIERTFGHGTAREALRAFKRALHSRINVRGGVPHSYGRRDTQEAFYAAFRDARAVADYRTKRIVRSGSGLETKEARARFPDVHDRFRSRDNPSKCRWLTCPGCHEHVNVDDGATTTTWQQWRCWGCGDWNDWPEGSNAPHHGTKKADVAARNAARAARRAKRSRECRQCAGAGGFLNGMGGRGGITQCAKCKGTGRIPPSGGLAYRPNPRGSTWKGVKRWATHTWASDDSVHRQYHGTTFRCTTCGMGKAFRNGRWRFKGPTDPSWTVRASTPKCPRRNPGDAWGGSGDRLDRRGLTSADRRRAPLCPRHWSDAVFDVVGATTYRPAVAGEACAKCSRRNPGGALRLVRMPAMLAKAGDSIEIGRRRLTVLTVRHRRGGDVHLRVQGEDPDNDAYADDPDSPPAMYVGTLHLAAAHPVFAALYPGDARIRERP